MANGAAGVLRRQTGDRMLWARAAGLIHVSRRQCAVRTVTGGRGASTDCFFFATGSVNSARQCLTTKTLRFVFGPFVEIMPNRNRTRDGRTVAAHFLKVRA